MLMIPMVLYMLLGIHVQLWIEGLFPFII